MQAVATTMEDLYHNTFLGVKTLQSWHDLMLWEKFLQQHQDITTIVEIGTYEGGFSTFLALQCLQRGIVFRTYDITTRKGLFSPVAELLGLHLRFIKGDVFLSPSFIVSPAALAKPLLLYCDGGNKKREMLTFVPLLYPGDYVAVHDWGAEVAAHGILPVAPLLEKLFWKECAILDSRTRFWRRIAADGGGQSNNHDSG